MNSPSFTVGDVKEHVAGRLRAIEQEYFQYAVEFEIAIAEKNPKKMFNLFVLMKRLEPTITSLHAQLN